MPSVVRTFVSSVLIGVQTVSKIMQLKTWLQLWTEATITVCRPAEAAVSKGSGGRPTGQHSEMMSLGERQLYRSLRAASAVKCEYEICALLGCCSASNGKFLPTFPDNLSVQS